MQQPVRLGSLLIKKHLINQQQLDNALHLQGQAQLPLGQALIQLGYVNQRQINKALKKQNRLRLYAAIIAFFMAPFAHLSHASGDIESLPEYSYTQVADLHFDDEVVFKEFAMNQNNNGAQFNPLEMTTAAAWFLYAGGLQDNQIQDVPIKINLTSTSSDSYTLNVSMAF